jgi:hypothetical protein
VVLDRHVLALDVPGFAEALAELGGIARKGISRPGADKPDDRQSRLLRSPRDRPRRRASEPRDEVPPSHQRSPYGWIGSLSRSGLYVWP